VNRFSVSFSFVLLAFILSLAIPKLPSAEMDTRRISLSSEYADPVKWLNIEGPPFWVGGVEPQYSFDEGSHLVELTPGDDVRLIVTTGEGVLAQGDPEQLSTLEWSISNGSGLWADAVAEKTSAPNQRLLPFSMWNTRLVAIRHPAEAERPIKIALFISRRDGGTNIRFERKAIPIGSVRRTLMLGLQPQAGTLYELTPGEDRAVEVEGPHRYLGISSNIESSIPSKSPTVVSAIASSFERANVRARVNSLPIPRCGTSRRSQGAHASSGASCGATSTSKRERTSSRFERTHHCSPGFSGPSTSIERAGPRTPRQRSKDLPGSRIGPPSSRMQSRIHDRTHIREPCCGSHATTAESIRASSRRSARSRRPARCQTFAPCAGSPRRWPSARSATEDSSPIAAKPGAPKNPVRTSSSLRAYAHLSTTGIATC